MQEKRSVGRPRLDEVDRRDCVISVRVTRGGMAKIKKLADAKGLSVNAYVRTVLHKLFNGEIIYR